MVVLSERYDELDRRFPGRLEKGRSLADLTTFRIGGAADRLVVVDDPFFLQELLSAARESKIPAFLLGGGSNLLIDEKGIRGLVLLNRMRRCTWVGRQVRVEGGLGFHELIVQSVESGLGGREFAAGIPGTVAGAVWGNAGCYGQAIGDFVLEGRWIDVHGEMRTVQPQDFLFDYRESHLKRNHAILLDILLELEAGDNQRSLSIIHENLEARRQKHPREEPCAGSYFKNVPPPDPDQRRIPAGRLLEEVGAKDLAVGGAAVFPKHANIIINRGGATANDVLALAAEMKRRVKDHFGIRLEEEVSYVPPDLKGFAV